MNPLASASLAFLLAVSQAVAVEAKGKSKSKGKKVIPIALIAGVVIAAVVILAIIALLFFLIRKRSRKLKQMNVPVQPQHVVYNNGGYPPGPEKDSYSPYVASQTASPLLASHGSPGWEHDAPPPHFNSAPAFPAPYGPPHA